MFCVAFVDDAKAQTYDGETPVAASDALVMGDWLFRPYLELRSQAEFRFHPFDVGGTMITTRPSSSPIGGTQAEVEKQWWVLSRGRMGLSAERGYLRAVLELQDARLWGELSPLRLDARDRLPSTGARLAYGEVRGVGSRASFLRIGRQQVVWGDGRLLGASDFSPTGRSLDAVRGQWVLGDFDLEGFSSILVSPGAAPAPMRRETLGSPEGMGTHLHGLRLAWHIAPWLHLQSNNLGRFARFPTEHLIDPGDLYLTGLRVWGGYVGVSYALEGAYEAGRDAAVGSTRSRSAWAVAANANYETGLWWNLGLGVEGAYATGQKKGESAITRFDPMLPDNRVGRDAMGLVAWSNVIDVGATATLSPHDDAQLVFGYRYLAMAEPSDGWQTADMVFVGEAPNNDESFLGHELDARMRLSPWGPLDVEAGYGLFLTGPGAKNVLEASGRGRPNLQHYGYLQTTFRIP
ncbi:MAG TPA: alginate export family protein [Polyangiaceae bacterium]|nr:MAG: hypothetical protein BWY17_00184 [Deltaproteobacteria bacterium ADurb.Bin207]HNS98730.1 alginate export family protein [Polyangiaceae bacterium]HNZ22687.1 alginate export family protein [Polyangiaceae bacterium]HOE49269.1 alginate export family protein [Polyangiaceae bacterium]HOH00356.1 alginate export family protein [Polyangiaceae bacterium]